MKKSLLVVLVMLGLCIVTGCGKKDLKAYSVGDMVSLDGLQYRLLKVKDIDDTLIHRADEGYVFKLVTLEIKNITDETKAYHTNLWGVLAGENQKILAELPLVGEKPFLKDGKLKAGESIQGNLVYQVKKGSSVTLGYFKTEKATEPLFIFQFD